MKGKEADKEIISGNDAIKKLGGSIEEVVDTPIIDAKGDVLSRKIVVIAKISQTPLGYPRKAGLAKKRPL
jgi:16S rRNA (guanine527-N7)-methyltransferase